MIFLICAGAAVYVIAGYPLLLALLARFRSVPAAAASSCRPTVTVLLAVRNGARWIGQKLESLLALDYPRELVDILVIADGSTDQTVDIASRYPVRVLEIPAGGKAVALNRGMNEAGGEILFFTDVRQRLDPQSLRFLVDCFADPTVGAATGELIILDGQTQEEANVGLYWKYEKWIRRRLSRIDSVLGATGCIYAMRRSLARPMPAGTLLDDVHLPMGAFLAGYRIVMVDQARAYDTPTGLEAEFRRKVRTQAGVYQLAGQFPRLLLPGRMWIHFISYKFGRLMLPFLLVGMAVGTCFLEDPWRFWVAGGQILFYLIAWLNSWVPGSWAVKRLTAPASAFVVLVGAALCAAPAALMAPQKLWKTR